MADPPSAGGEGPVGIRISGPQGHMRLIGARGTNLARFVDAHDATLASLEAHGNTNTTMPGAESSLYVGELSMNAAPLAATPVRPPDVGHVRGNSTAFFGDHPWRQREALRTWAAAVCEAHLALRSRAERATWPSPLLFSYYLRRINVTGLPPFPTELSGPPRR